MTVEGTVTTLHSFDLADGAQPYSPLSQSTKGNFYGATPNGGENNQGTVFGLATGLKPFVRFVRSAGPVGATCEILGQGFKGTSRVYFNGVRTYFTVLGPDVLSANVPPGATTGFVTVVTPSGPLRTNVPYIVLP